MMRIAITATTVDGVLYGVGLSATFLMKEGITVTL